MKTILITGAAGFLGSYLSKTLLSNNQHVIGLDNLSTGTMDNLQAVLSHPNFTFIPCDVSKEETYRCDVDFEIAEIYHLASPASPRSYQKWPLETIAVNTIGTKNMLELAKRNDAKLVFTSTSEAYGDPEIHPQPEEYRGNVNTWGPRACYDEAKRMGETYCYEYHSRYGVKVKVARLFNTYSAGLRNDDGRVLSNFVTQALTGADLTVYGDGTQSRSFCYVKDTIRGLLLLMESSLADGQLVNIGNSQEHTILDVAHLILKMTGSSSAITFHPLPQDDPKMRRPVIRKANALLSWAPQIALEEGLREMIADYRGKLLLGENLPLNNS